VATSGEKTWFDAWKILPWRSGSANTSTEVVHRPRSRSPLHFDNRNIEQIRSEEWFPSARHLLSAALLDRWPQVCRVKITCTKVPTDHFVSTTKNSMRCVVNWIPLRIRVRSRNTQPHLNFETNIKLHCLYYLCVLIFLNCIIMFQCVIISYHLIHSTTYHIASNFHSRFFIS